ncbi:YcdB/YcdC domain-containing protein [Petroclostridium sp. X23]|uniref:YcdB/YcdC domain-containing protein n=1 Tax=Petroclostridium sp. X23 TaxID=3045146 RepID=UPI0024AD95AF|nr:YcdB/YcdC domain-containing protein [Petroclostridium sp. X23]WHH60563.1 S-layer homology domain-containing protein [Petroclostridium sp. X23]
MKKKIALLMTIIMLTACLLPSLSLAADDQGLEKAIKTTKEKFTIPSTLTEFNYTSFTENNKQTWQLTWNSKDGLDGNMHVRIDNDGNILSYNYYKPYQYDQRKLPKISKQEAKTKAEQFIKYIHPEIASQLKYMENIDNTLMQPTYYFNYVRLVNGIPVPNDNVFVEVNTETGEVQSFYYNWTKDRVFPDANKAITLKDAQEAYKKNLGLRLIYNYTYDNDQLKTYAVYTAKYPYGYDIDALTGNKLETSAPYYLYGDGGGMGYREQAKAEEPVLTPEEMNAVEEASSLMSQAKAEKIARDFKTLELTDEFKLMNANLSRHWPVKQDFIWQLYFEKASSDKANDYQYVSVTINAKTGEIKAFYQNGPYKGEEEGVYDQDAAKEAVEKFIKQIQPEKFGQTEFDDTYTGDVIIYASSTKPTQYNFRYLRKVNDVLFPSNYIQVGYDAVNGKVTNYQLEWYDITFAPVDNIITLDQVYEKMFNEIGLELQYKLVHNKDSAKIIRPEYGTENIEIKLVYTVKNDKPLLFDANTGNILNYDGKPYKDNKTSGYTDISGHFAESAIKALAEYGIVLKGTEFKPDESITQKNFFTLLSKTLNYYGYDPASSEDNKEIDELYKYLIREGIVKENEKAPDADVTREDSVKFIIRALKYDKVADIKGIFNCTFKDIEKINPDLIGYVTIAQGLKIISGNDGYFNPQNKLTRAETAIIIYNYLKR